MQGQLPRHTVATGCYGKELKSASAMDFTEKLHINLVFPDEDFCNSLPFKGFLPLPFFDFNPLGPP